MKVDNGAGVFLSGNNALINFPYYVTMILCDDYCKLIKFFDYFLNNTNIDLNSKLKYIYDIIYNLVNNKDQNDSFFKNYKTNKNDSVRKCIVNFILDQY